MTMTYPAQDPTASPNRPTSVPRASPTHAHGSGGVRLRNDGRYALVASERGKEGPQPPGNVYLISVDNLRTKELRPGNQAEGRRLEFMGFSLSGKEIFVARQFYLDVYDLEGNRTKSVQLE